MRVTRENFKCMRSTCRFLWWPCDHSQRSGLLQTSKLLEKAADFNIPHFRRFQGFQNPCDDDNPEHGMQVWSFDHNRTSLQPYCDQEHASTVIFRSGHSIQNRTDCNWFCTLLQLMDGLFHTAVSVEEKDCRWFSVAHLQETLEEQFSRRRPKRKEPLLNHLW